MVETHSTSRDCSHVNCFRCIFGFWFFSLLAVKLLTFVDLYEADKTKHASTEGTFNSAEPQDQVFYFYRQTNEVYIQTSFTEKRNYNIIFRTKTKSGPQSMQTRFSSRTKIENFLDESATNLY